jgi:HEAT repeat protein
MRRLRVAALAAVVCCGGPPAVSSSGGDAPAGVAGRVAAILERFPAETKAQKDALSAEILTLGKKAAADVCARVLPPGVGDDSRARFAVNGLAVHVMRPGAEAERVVLAGVFLDALGRAKDETVVAFFLSQVRLVGKQESIPSLRRYLHDERLVAPAAGALLSIGGPQATRALLAALDEAPASARVALVFALGEARSREAVKKLLPLADSPDEGLRQAALFALANIGDPSARSVFSRPREGAPRKAAPALDLLYARRLLETGRTSEGLSAARAALDDSGRSGASSQAPVALSLLVSALGPRALPDLLAAADSPDRAFRGVALLLAEQILGSEATLRWVEKARAAPPERRADIVAMLGRRGDAAALPFVRETLRSVDEVVRLVAIPAATRLGGAAVLPDLLALLGSADATECAALRTALLAYPGPLVAPEAARLLDGTPLPAKVVLVDVLGEKGAHDEIGRVFLLAEEPEPAVREAALTALGRLAVDADVARLVSMLEKASASDDVVRLREAIASAVLRNPDPERRADGLLDLLKDACPAGRIAILKVLPRIGGAGPLGAVVQELANPNPEVRGAALGALSRWPDDEAADELLRVASTTRDRDEFRTAVQGYVRLIGRSRRPAVRKLAAFETLLGLPGRDDDKMPVLAAMAAVREPESLRLLAGYLDDPVRRDAAAAALLDLASRQSDEEPWLSGHEAHSALRRVRATLADPAARERADRTIGERLRRGGFVPLFDGRSLDGWKGLVADPPARAKMTPQELASAQGAADASMRAHWTAKDGVLAFDGKGESLCTARDYGDFELVGDWKIERGGDSGLYLRGSPQVQIWDAEANAVGSGGLYNNERGPSRPLENADRPVGEWNAFRILMIGERVTVYLNDKRVVDDAVLENYWERDKPIYASGQLELQAHGNPLWFRNLFVREIPREASVPMAVTDAGEGFTSLFNGRDLEGWTGGAEGYAVEDGKIVVHPERGGGNLYTVKEYTDFVLRFDFKLNPAANNGLGIRAPLEGDAAYVGMELQILEDGSPVYWGLQPYQYHGSIYGVVPARRGVLRPVGEWNSEEVTVAGRRVSVVVNGTTVVDADIDEASAAGTMDGKDHPGLKRARGHVGFLGHGSVLEIRNIRIKAR